METERSLAEIAALEGIETAAWADIYRSRSLSSAFRLETTLGIQGVALFGLTSVPWTEFNRAQGFRPGSELSRRTIETVIEWLQTNAAEPWALQFPEPMLDDRLLATLGEAGLESKGRGVAKLYRRVDKIDTTGTTRFEIRRIGADRAPDFAATVQRGFGGSPVLADVFSALPGRPGWSTYVAYDGEEPVACGALFVEGSLGWVGIGATRPEWRGQGAQSALIGRRLSDGHQAGVAVFAAEAGAPAAGDERQAVSFNNLTRAGFRLAYRRRSFGPIDGRR